MATDAVPLNLLRSSLDQLKLRFQAVATESAKPIRAWMIHVHIQQGETPDIYSRVNDMIDSYYWPTEEPTPSALLWQMGVAAIGRGVPPFRREIRAKCSTRLSTIGEDAATLLNGLPPSVAARLWRDLPARTELRTGAGLPLWALACFEMANANVVGSPLRAFRSTPVTEEVSRTLLAVGINLPADPNWSAMLQDFAAASVQAIDILASWLDTATVEPADTPSGKDAQPKGTADDEQTARLKPCEAVAWSQYGRAAGQNAELETDRRAYDWFAEHIADDSSELPTFATWSRHLRAARKAMNQNKNGPRIGNETRSVVSAARIG